MRVAVLLLSSLAVIHAQQRPSVSKLVRQFQSETMFFRQFEAAKAIVAANDKSVLPQLEPWLTDEDRHARGSAPHLLGDLKDPRAVPILAPLRKDSDVNYIVPWSLKQIGDRSATPPLIGTLSDPDPSIPRLRQLFQDDTRSNFGK